MKRAGGLLTCVGFAGCSFVRVAFVRWRSSPLVTWQPGPRSLFARRVRHWPVVRSLAFVTVGDVAAGSCGTQRVTRGGGGRDGVLTWHRRWVRWRSFVGVGDVAVLLFSTVGGWWRRWAGMAVLARWRRRDRRCGRDVGGGWAVVVVVGRNI